jgi:hypothetical protein
MAARGRSPAGGADAPPTTHHRYRDKLRTLLLKLVRNSVDFPRSQASITSLLQDLAGDDVWDSELEPLVPLDYDSVLEMLAALGVPRYASKLRPESSISKCGVWLLNAYCTPTNSRIPTHR